MPLVKANEKIVGKEIETCVVLKEEKKSRHGPGSSQKLLMDYIGGKGGISLDEALAFGERKDIWFGPGVPIIEILANKPSK